MRIQTTIENKIREQLAPVHFEVMNESHMHNVPPGSESHFKVVVVTELFEGSSLVQRHQKVNGVLASELQNDIHALAMQTLTPSEWTARGGVTPDSPDCHGGSAADQATN